MKDSIKILLTGIIVAGAALSVGLLIKGTGKILNQDTPLKEVTDLREDLDSTQNQIDTIFIELKDVHQNYQKVVDSVINNDPNADYRFFIEYIGSQRERLDSIMLSNKSK